MPTRVLHTVTAPPPHRLTPADVEAGWATLVGDASLMDGLRKLIASSAVAERQVVLPVDRLTKPRGAGARNDEFRQASLEHGERCLRKLFDESGADPARIDVIVTVSCTGLLIPSLDAYLMNRLGINKAAVRLPITELGCAGGLAALNRAAELLAGRPGGRAVVLAAEFPSLTLNVKNLEPVNVVSSVLFGDGVAAALLEAGEGPGLTIEQTASELYEHTEYLMGFDLTDDGLQVVLDRDVPPTIDANIRRSVGAFLERAGLAAAGPAFLLLHPGGRKLVDHVEARLGLAPETTALSRAILRDHGNMSSATILYVLDRFLRREAPRLPSGARGLAVAMGPGFSIEQAALRWAA